MKKIHWILTGLSFSIILLSLNRLTAVTQIYLQPYDYLRLMDFLAMIPIPLFSCLLYFLLKKEVVTGGKFVKTSLYTFLELILITGIFLFAAGSGDHEVTNYLSTRFCDRGETVSTLCNIIRYNDDEFSHYVYYAGFILMNVALMVMEYKSHRVKPIQPRDLFLILPNALIIALGIFANLAFEEIGIDLYVFGFVMILSLIFLWKTKNGIHQLPVTFYFALSYVIGVTSTIIYKSFGG